MRRSGRTTTIVDKAVQILFKNGAVMFPYVKKDRIRGEDKKLSMFYDHYCRDVDYKGIVKVQNIIEETFYRRIFIEHGIKLQHRTSNQGTIYTI